MLSVKLATVLLVLIPLALAQRMRPVLCMQLWPTAAFVVTVFRLRPPHRAAATAWRRWCSLPSIRVPGHLSSMASLARYYTFHGCGNNRYGDCDNDVYFFLLIALLLLLLPPHLPLGAEVKKHQQQQQQESSGSNGCTTKSALAQQLPAAAVAAAAAAAAT